MIFEQVADDGAVIVSGSQAHAPLEMEFYKGTFIHYGLGNLFLWSDGQPATRSNQSQNTTSTCPALGIP